MKIQAPTDIDIYAPGFIDDPWPAYRRLHEAGPLLWHPALQLWLVAGHDAARLVLRDATFGVTEVSARLAELAARARRSFPSLCGIAGAIPFLNNPPAHTAMRRFVAGVLAVRPISALVPEMRELAAQLLADGRAAGGLDAVRDYADRLPQVFIARLLGMPEPVIEQLAASAVRVSEMFNRTVRVREYQALEHLAAEGVEVLRAAVAERRRSPAVDGISRMLAANPSPSDLEAAYTVYALYLVGSETTTTLIGSAIRALLEHPALYAAARSDRSLVRPIIEETLRRETPVQTSTRVAGEARELAGQNIAAGDRLVVMLGAANRDPAAYPEPDRFDPRREGPSHLAFADGMHSCVGATLARAETQAALDAFLDLPVCRRQTGADAWWPRDWLRRLRTLPVQFVG